METAMKTLIAVPLMVMVALVAPASSRAQLGFLDAVGYGSAGLVAGAVATEGACDDLCLHPVALGAAALGAILGGRIGRRAELSIQRGEAARRLPMVTMGAVLGSSALGLVFGAAVTDGSDATWAFGVAGAGLTVLYLHSRWGELTGSRLTVSPAMMNGQPGLAASIRF